jgi:hypothetical protein
MAAIEFLDVVPRYPNSKLGFEARDNVSYRSLDRHRPEIFELRWQVRHGARARFAVFTSALAGARLRIAALRRRFRTGTVWRTNTRRFES